MTRDNSRPAWQKLAPVFERKARHTYPATSQDLRVTCDVTGVEDVEIMRHRNWLCTQLPLPGQAGKLEQRRRRLSVNGHIMIL